MSYDTIIFEILENVGVIKFNRPESLNALSSNLINELADALDKNKVRLSMARSKIKY